MRVLLTGIVLLMITAPIPAQGFLEIGTVTQLDQDNWVRLEVAQFDSPGHASGSTPRFMGEREGVPFDWVVVNEQRDSHPTPIRPQVLELCHRDQDHVWLVVRLGHRLQGAYLVSLESGRVEANYTGVGFTLSPDRQHIAFTYPDMGTDPVFLDDSMVFPERQTGMNHTPMGMGDPPGPRLRDGRSPAELSTAEAGAQLAGPLSWEDSGELTFLISGGRGPHPYRLFRVQPPGTAMLQSTPLSSETTPLRVEQLTIPSETGDQAAQTIWEATRTGGTMGWLDALPSVVSAEFLPIE